MESKFNEALFIMAIRLTNITIWQRDWYLNLDGKYQLFVHYLRDHCDHAGVWQPAFKLFEKITGFRINQEEFLSTVNSESIRILVLENGKWWLTGFIEDQYRTNELSDTINPHKGVINSIDFNRIPYKSYGYNLTLRKGTEGVKDKDKDKDKNTVLNSNTNTIQEGGVGETIKENKYIYSPDFEIFWSQYPKKVGKGNAFLKWKIAIKTTNPQDIISGAKKYCEKTINNKTDVGYIKNPEGWISARRWEDDYTIPTKPTPPKDEIQKANETYREEMLAWEDEQRRLDAEREAAKVNS